METHLFLQYLACIVGALVASSLGALYARLSKDFLQTGAAYSTIMAYYGSILIVPFLCVVAGPPFPLLAFVLLLGWTWAVASMSWLHNQETVDDSPREGQRAALRQATLLRLGAVFLGLPAALLLFKLADYIFNNEAIVFALPLSPEHKTWVYFMACTFALSQLVIWPFATQAQKRIEYRNRRYAL